MKKTTTQIKTSISQVMQYAGAMFGVQRARNDAMLHLLGDGVAEVDLDGRLIYSNPAWNRLLGRPLDPAASSYFWELFEGLEQRLAARRAFDDHCRLQTEPTPFEARLVRADASVFEANIGWGFCRDKRGRLTGMVLVIQDISGLRNTEQQAMAREQLSRAVFDSMFQFTFVLSPEGVLLDANRAAGVFMRTVVERATGRLLCELPPWAGMGLHCEQLRMNIANAKQGAFQRFESEFVGHHSGLVNIDFSLKPVRDVDGEVLLLLLEGRDVSERVQSESLVQAEREQFRNIIEAGQAGFIIVDVDGNVQYMNNYARRILGDAAEKVVSRNALSHNWMVSGAKHFGENLFVRIVGTGEAFTESEIEVSLPGGRRMLLRLSGTPMREASGRVSAVVFSFEDITVRKAATDALQASESRLRAIYNSIFDGLISIDARGHIFEMNPAAERIFDYGIAELQDKNISMLMPSPFADRHDDYLAAYLRGGGPNLIGKVRELTGLRKGGIPFPMELTVTEGRLGGERIFTGVVRDLSEKKRAEELQRRLLSIVEASPDLIGMTNKDGDIVHLNRAGRRFFGATPSEQLPMETLAAHAPWARKKLVQEALPTAQSHGIWTGQSALLSPERGELPVLESILAHDTSSGSNNYYSVICRDISASKRIENVKDALITTVSHELRTPLTSIHGSLRLLEAGIAGKVDDEARAVLQLALNGANRLEHLINNFLYIDAIESGRVSMECHSIDLGNALKEAVQAALTAPHQVEIVFPRPDAPVLALAHPEHVRQVFANLLSNAVKFTRPGSRVDVSLIEELKAVRIEIADRGPGITRTFGNQVFQKFARADASDRRETKGSGLGLSIAWALVTGMGGGIGFRAREGGGTIFWVDFKR